MTTNAIAFLLACALVSRMTWLWMSRGPSRLHLDELERFQDQLVSDLGDREFAEAHFRALEENQESPKYDMSHDIWWTS